MYVFQIGGMDSRFATRLLDLVDHTGQRFGTTANNDDFGTFGGKHFGGFAPDSCARSGNDGNFSVQPAHVILVS